MAQHCCTVCLLVALLQYCLVHPFLVNQGEGPLESGLLGVSREKKTMLHTAQAGTADPFTSSPLFAESEHHASAVFVVAVGARQRYCPFRNQPLIPRMCVSSTPFDAPPRPFGEPPASSPAYSAHVNNVRARASTSPSLLRSALCCNMANQNKSETSSVVTRVSSDTQATLTCETA